MKRANGTGSVFRAPGRRRKPWVVRMSVWVEGETGKERKYKYMGTYRTKAEAEKALALFDAMPLSEKHSITLKDLFEEWKQTRAYLDISEKTRSNYDNAYKHIHLYENKVFSDLRLAHWQSIVDNAAATGLSYSSLSKIRTLISILSKYAVAQDISYKNYSSLIKLPRMEKSAPKVFSELEVKRIESKASTTNMDILLCLIYTGMRISELFNLTKFDVDLESSLIVGGLKTDAGKNRIIPIHPKISPFITQRYNSCENYIFERERGLRMTVDYFRRKIYPCLLETADVPFKAPHATRHTFISLLSKKSTDTNSIKDLAGHTDYGFTANRYDHPDIERLRAVIETL